MKSTIFLSSRLVFACLVAWAACAPPVQAALVLNGTRVIFPEGAREVTMRIDNNGNEPVLAQNWIDDGRLDARPEQLHVPFVVAPAVGRVDPSKGAVLRITYTQEPLPADRESVYWLNVLEVPSIAGEDSDVLRFAFRTRIKLFYRPAALKEGVFDAPDKLVWRVLEASGNPTRNRAHTVIEVRNPTPYYVSFGQVESDVAGSFASAGGGMVAPFGATRFEFSGAESRARSDAKVRYQVIDDYGGRTTITKPLSD
jgi:P pilus assembly chaperone PapD